MASNLQSFTLNSIDYGDPAYGVYVVDDGGPWCPEFRVDLQPLAGAHGAVSQGQYLGPRYWTLRCVLVAASAAARVTQVYNVMQALAAAHAAGETEFSLDAIERWTWMARPIGEVNATEALCGAEFEVRIVAPNPIGTYDDVVIPH